MQLGMTEILLIAVVALFVIGPRQLPGALKRAGIYLKKFRQMTGELRRSVDDAIREAELEEATNTAKALRNVGNLKQEVASRLSKSIDPERELEQAMNLEPSIEQAGDDSNATSEEVEVTSKVNRRETKPVDPVFEQIMARKKAREEREAEEANDTSDSKNA